jgi:hypothetical protein
MKQKYRFTPYMRGVTGLQTIYRWNIQTGIDWIIADFKKTAILRNFEGHVMIYERKYRKHDRCLHWKPIQVMHIIKGEYTIEDRDDGSWEKLYHNSME